MNSLEKLKFAHVQILFKTCVHFKIGEGVGGGGGGARGSNIFLRKYCFCFQSFMRKI